MTSFSILSKRCFTQKLPKTFFLALLLLQVPQADCSEVTTPYRDKTIGKKIVLGTIVLGCTLYFIYSSHRLCTTIEELKESYASIKRASSGFLDEDKVCYTLPTKQKWKNYKKSGFTRMSIEDKDLVKYFNGRVPAIEIDMRGIKEVQKSNKIYKVAVYLPCSKQQSLEKVLIYVKNAPEDKEIQMILFCPCKMTILEENTHIYLSRNSKKLLFYNDSKKENITILHKIKDKGGLKDFCDWQRFCIAHECISIDGLCLLSNQKITFHFLWGKKEEWLSALFHMALSINLLFIFLLLFSGKNFEDIRYLAYIYRFLSTFIGLRI